jgi:23S rRNA pseudouridine2605 synthase
VKSKKADKSVEEPEAGSGPDGFVPVEASPEGAAKPRAQKKAALKAEAVEGAKPASAAKKTPRKSAAKKSAVADENVAETEPSPAKKPRAKKIVKGRSLVEEVPAVAEIAEVLHETPQKVLTTLAADAHEIREEDLEEAEASAGDGDTESYESEAEDEAEENETAAYQEKPGNPERLQKLLAKAGIASRRAAEEMILAGRVQVNGKIVTELGTKAELGRDHIRVDGKLLQGAERLRYFVLNKPKGYVTTVSDPEGRPTVMQFFAAERERLYPVGRLDYLSEGLLLVTNDGELANKLTKAASGVEKTYLVKVSGTPPEEELDQIREGVVIERGRIGEGSGRVRTAPAQIRKVREGDNPWYEVILIEGRNREIRKLFEEIGHHVEKIRRVGYGPLVLDLEPGKTRVLTDEEVHKLRLTAEGKLKPRRRRGPAPAQLERKAGRAVQHERSGDRTPRRKTAENAEVPASGRRERPAVRPALYDRPDFSELSAPARNPRNRAPITRPQSDRPQRDASTGQSAGRRDFKPTRPSPNRPAPTRSSFGERQVDRPRAERPSRPSFGERPEGRPAKTGPANFNRPEKPLDRPEKRFGSSEKPFDKPARFNKPFDRASGSRSGRNFAGRGSEDRKSFRSREEAQEQAEFGVEPIERTPGFRVEPVADTPRPARPPRAEFFDSRGPGRSASRPFRAEGSRPDSREGRPPRRGENDRPFRKPEGRTTGRPAGKPYGDRPARPFRERADDRGSSSRSAGSRSSGPRPAGSRPAGTRSTGPRRDSAGDRPDFRPRRTFSEGEDRPREFRPRPGTRPPSSDRPKPFGAKRKPEEGDAPRVKNRWRNSFEGKNKGRPKPKPKKDA